MAARDVGGARSDNNILLSFNIFTFFLTNIYNFFFFVNKVINKYITQLHKAKKVENSFLKIQKIKSYIH